MFYIAKTLLACYEPYCNISASIRTANSEFLKHLCNSFIEYYYLVLLLRSTASVLVRWTSAKADDVKDV